MNDFCKLLLAVRGFISWIIAAALADAFFVGFVPGLCYLREGRHAKISSLFEGEGLGAFAQRSIRRNELIGMTHTTFLPECDLDNGIHFHAIQFLCGELFDPKGLPFVGLFEDGSPVFTCCRADDASHPTMVSSISITISIRMSVTVDVRRVHYPQETCEINLFDIVEDERCLKCAPFESHALEDSRLFLKSRLVKSEQDILDLQLPDEHRRKWAGRNLASHQEDYIAIVYVVFRVLPANIWNGVW